MLELSDKEWEQRLTPLEYEVLRKERTEVPYTGEFLYNDKAGTYACAACGNVLFDSTTKFEDHCGWPSFYDARKGAVEFVEDSSHHMRRTSVKCSNCGGHIGHIFDDVPEQPTGQRYCVNSAALKFLEEERKKQ